MSYKKIEFYLYYIVNLLLNSIINMISYIEIRDNLARLNMRETDYNKKYWYLYSVNINGMAVAKPGISTVNILTRIYNYINKEHSNQEIRNFNLIVLIEFKREKSLKGAENFIKENTDARFNIFTNQPHQLEQYQLKNFYDEIKDYFSNFPFSSKSYINQNASEIIENTIKLQTVSYLTTLYQSNKIDINQNVSNKIKIESKSKEESHSGNTWVNSHYRSSTYVNGYYRRDGTYVRGHLRSGCDVSGHFRHY